MAQSIQRLDVLKKSRDDISACLLEQIARYQTDLSGDLSKGDFGLALQKCDWLRSLCVALREVDSLRK